LDENSNTEIFTSQIPHRDWKFAPTLLADHRVTDH
jgi:hypothetical protein